MNTRRNGNSALQRPILRGTVNLELPGKSGQVDPRKQIMADFCRTIGATIRGEVPLPFTAPELPRLSPRMKQTLQRLLAGDSEKQIAGRLGVSRHTVHVYVKALYRSFAVGSRGELLARFVRPPALSASRQSPRHSPAGHGYS